jgi:amino acid transporter
MVSPPNSKNHSLFSARRATLLVIANAIGTGIFTTTGFVLEDLQSPTLVFGVWVLGALYSLLGVACYQELHRIYPGSGGEYNFLSRGLHPFLGHFGGWVSLVAGFSAPIAGSALAFSIYAQKAVGEFMNPTLLSSLVIVCIFVFHGFFSYVGFKIHDRFVWGKILGMVTLVGAAAVFAPWEPSAPHYSTSDVPMSSIANSFFWIAYAYSGWNAVYYVASEVAGSEAAIKKASYLGTAGVCLIYLAVNAVLLFSIDVTPLVGREEVVGIYLEQIFGHSAGHWLSALIAFGLVSTASALFITGPRVYARMAADGVLPRAFHVPPGTFPKNATILQAGLALCFLWSAQFEVILKFVGFSLSFCCVLAVSVILFAPRGRHSLFHRFLAFLFCGSTGWLVFKGIPGNLNVFYGVLALLGVSVISWLRRPKTAE